MDGGCERFDPGDGALALYAQAFVAEAPAWFAALMAEVRWEQHWLSLFGRRIAAPRLSAWYAEPGCSYRYSGLSLAAQPFTPPSAAPATPATPPPTVPQPLAPPDEAGR